MKHSFRVHILVLGLLILSLVILNEGQKRAISAAFDTPEVTVEIIDRSDYDIIDKSEYYFKESIEFTNNYFRAESEALYILGSSPAAISFEEDSVAVADGNTYIEALEGVQSVLLVDGEITMFSDSEAIVNASNGTFYLISGLAEITETGRDIYPNQSVNLRDNLTVEVLGDLSKTKEPVIVEILRLRELARK